MNEFIDVFYEVLSKSAKIFLGYPTTLMKLDMKEFDTDTYFISDFNCEKDKVIMIKDEESKKKLYKFCVENKDRVFRGEKC